MIPPLSPGLIAAAINEQERIQHILDQYASDLWWRFQIENDLDDSIMELIK